MMIARLQLPQDCDGIQDRHPVRVQIGSRGQPFWSPKELTAAVLRAQRGWPAGFLWWSKRLLSRIWVCENSDRVHLPKLSEKQWSIVKMRAACQKVIWDAFWNSEIWISDRSGIICAFQECIFWSASQLKIDIIHFLMKNDLKGLYRGACWVKWKKTSWIIFQRLLPNLSAKKFLKSMKKYQMNLKCDHLTWICMYKYLFHLNMFVIW